MIVGAITPCGQCYACLEAHKSQCGADTEQGYRRSAAGASATRSTAARPSTSACPYAMANLAPVPDELTDEQVLMCPDIMSTGFARRRERTDRDRRHRRRVRAGADRPVRDAGARLRGATRIIAVDGMPERLEMARRLGADTTIDCPRGGSGRGDHAAYRRPRRRRRDRGARHARRPSRAACGC